MIELDIAISPCPNDTFAFHGMLEEKAGTKNFKFKRFMFDVEELNRRAFEKKFHITKLSFHAWLKLKESYEILDSGAALGRGCGPVLIARSKNIDLLNAKIAIPGVLTTAFLLLRMWKPGMKNFEATRFDNILRGVQTGKYDAGLIIHEGRFVYEDFNCVKIVDLGDWWERETGMPLPLGCMTIKKEKPAISYKREIEKIIAESVKFALKNRHLSENFVRKHARELNDEVINRHIDLYVNDFTLSLGEEGKAAIRLLEKTAKCRKII